MPSQAISIDIAVPPERVFDLLHDYRQRLAWDPFLRRADILEAATAALGVRTLCAAKLSGGGTRVTYRYHFRVKPAWLAFALAPVLGLAFARETRARLAALKRFLETPQR